MADGIWAMVDGGWTYAINRISHQPFAISHQPSAMTRRYRFLTSYNVPAPPPSAAPISAPFLPPKIAPRPAPAAVVPPMTIAVFVQLRPDDDCTERTGSVRVTTCRVATRRGAGYVSYSGNARTSFAG